MSQTDLHFSLFPAGGVEIASSRIRIYEFQSSLAKRGIQTTFGYSVKANVLLFQKKVTNENLWQARLAKLLGRVVIYDVDDLGDALWCWVSKSNFKKMLQIADVVTTSSMNQLDYLKSNYNVRKGYVVLSAIDYFPQEPVNSISRDGNKLQIAWFGNSSNIRLFEKYYKVLLQIPSSDLYAIVDKDKVPEFSNKYPGVHFIPWALCTFVSSLQLFDLVCLMHDGEIEDTAKSNNKMIASITCGVPAIVSRTPEYERTAREAGIEHAIFSDEAELQLVIERFRSNESRKQYLNISQPVIWNRYSPDSIAQHYIDIAQVVLDEKH